MRTPIVAGNWKMNKSAAEAVAFVQEFVGSIKLPEPCNAEIILCPPYLAIPASTDALTGTNFAVGAQDCFWTERGAFTSQISAKMLRNAGCHACIVGHSETRGKFGKLEVPESTLGFFAETDETVNLKIKSLLSEGLLPILCVGETLAEREAGKTDAIIQRQLRGALEGLTIDQVKTLVIAYEPVWAIGTGKTCDCPEANRVCGQIRAELGLAGAATRILYGGSVNAENARALFSEPDIDGGLVGGASLNPDSFGKVIWGTWTGD